MQDYRASPALRFAVDFDWAKSEFKVQTFVLSVYKGV